MLVKNQPETHFLTPAPTATSNGRLQMASLVRDWSEGSVRWEERERIRAPGCDYNKRLIRYV